MIQDPIRTDNYISLNDFKDIKDNLLNIITSIDTLIKALLSSNRHGSTSFNASVGLEQGHILRSVFSNLSINDQLILLEE